jgi:hypothetical protein
MQRSHRTTMSDIKASVRDYVHVRNPMQSPAMVDLEQYKQVVLLEYQKAADAGFPVSDQDISCPIINAVIEAHALGDP